MVMPVWWSNVGVGQNLPQALDVTLVNLCTLAENIFVQCIRHSGLPEYVAFYEIPVEKRDLTCPKRIGVTLHHSKLKPPMTPPAA